SDLTIDDGRLRTWPIMTWTTDAWQKFWIGTWGLGAAKGDLQSQTMELLPFGLLSPSVDAIGADGDHFWLAGMQEDPQNSGITFWNPEFGTPEYYEPHLLTGFSHDQITSIAVDGSTVWFGTRGGLTRYDRTKQIWRTYSQVHNLVDEWVLDIVVDDSSVWVATAGGVSRVDKATVGTDSLRIVHVMYPALRNLLIYDLELQANLLWMATEFGIYVYETDTGKGGFYKGTVGPADRETFALSSYGNLMWFATDEGIAALDVEKKGWLPPPTRLFDLDVVVHRLLADEYGVWAATLDGVWRFDYRSDRWIHYGIKDGLPSKKIHSIMLQDDYVWFGSDVGLTRFYWNSPFRID
ncbi:hypothetical protein JW992_01575, partial [candidate division KSB1 bacterium]|nr:hypothetical protein [candidate division KSB1 bacterium]